MFDTLRARLEALKTVPARALPVAAARIQAKLRQDATTARGNVPGYGDMGGPIIVTAGLDTITVSAPDWVQAKAAQLGQPAAWSAIVAEEISREARRA